MTIEVIARTMAVDLDRQLRTVKETFNGRAEYSVQLLDPEGSWGTFQMTCTDDREDAIRQMHLLAECMVQEDDDDDGGL